uniref:ClpP/crotonase n=1 Tax=Parastrongyloides trichosuri TaxID=131310 RepID=A0A0N5A6G8_PARTI
MFFLKRSISLTSRLPVNISRASVHIPEYKCLEVTKEGPAFKIALNIPSTYNALSYPLLSELADALWLSNKCKETKFTVVTGKGKFFCSGLDLEHFLKLGTDGIIETRDEMGKIFEKYVSSFLHHDKLLIGAINGPAIGGGVAMIPYFDYTICSDDAYFFTPFTKFGFVPVDLISVYLPRIMGKLRATEVMLLEKKLTSKEAFDCSLVNEVVKKEDVWKATMEKVKKFDTYGAEDVKAVKKVIKYDDRRLLDKKNKAEIKIFYDRLCEPTFIKAIEEYFKNIKK